MLVLVVGVVLFDVHLRRSRGDRTDRRVASIKVKLVTEELEIVSDKAVGGIVTKYKYDC